MSADPIYDGVKEGFGLYTYCRNNPLIYHDPSGLSVESTIKQAFGVHTYENKNNITKSEYRSELSGNPTPCGEIITTPLTINDIFKIELLSSDLNSLFDENNAVYIIDTNRIYGDKVKITGHCAWLIKDANGTWYYVSKDSEKTEDMYARRIGSIYEGYTGNNPVEFLKYLKGIGKPYNAALGFNLSQNNIENMLTTAKSNYKTTYMFANVLPFKSNNCGDLAYIVGSAGGIEITGSHIYVPVPITLSPLIPIIVNATSPNIQFSKLQKKYGHIDS